MKIAILLCVILLSISTFLYSSNILQIHDAQGSQNDTIDIYIEIINDDPFIAFQFDLPIPYQFSYLANSTSLLGREVDHVIISSIINNDTLRILSYSPSNTPFLGNNGMIASLKLIAGQQTGSFSLEPQNGIISDSNSSNILTGIVNGMIVIEPITDVDDQSMIPYEIINITKYPNPFTESITIALHLENCNVDRKPEVKIYNNRGQFIKKLSPQNFSYNLNDLWYYNWDGSNSTGDEVPTGSYLIRAVYSDYITGSVYGKCENIIYLKR